MTKNKKIKFFLILGVILFSLIGTTGCTIQNDNNDLDLTKDIPDYENIIKHFDLTDEKIIWEGDINQSFYSDNAVIVTMKKTNTYPELDLSAFGLDNAISMEYLDGVTRPENIANPHKWRQKIIIYLQPEGKEKLLETIRRLEQLEYVKYVNPNMIFEGC